METPISPEQPKPNFPPPTEATKTPLAEARQVATPPESPPAPEGSQQTQLEILWRVISPEQHTGRLIRLYRFEALPHITLQDDTQTGRWFTISRETAEGPSGGIRGPVGVRYVDVSENVFSRLAEQSTLPVGELLLPRELAESARPFTRDVPPPSGGLIPIDELYLQRVTPIRGAIPVAAKHPEAPLAAARVSGIETIEEARRFVDALPQTIRNKIGKVSVAPGEPRLLVRLLTGRIQDGGSYIPLTKRLKVVVLETAEPRLTMNILAHEVGHAAAWASFPKYRTSEKFAQVFAEFVTGRRTTVEKPLVFKPGEFDDLFVKIRAVYPELENIAAGLTDSAEDLLTLFPINNPGPYLRGIDPQTLELVAFENKMPLAVGEKVSIGRLLDFLRAKKAAIPDGQTVPRAIVEPRAGIIAEPRPRSPR